ncbi:hypothetical protein CBS101457_003771 [Exobasidium rhododendri]|nr:hypothetical protein CBS101457_003771 [Exobasidium rhododendri]
MPASMATKLGIQFARFAQYTAASAASSNPSASHTLRNAFSNATNGSAPTWTHGLNQGGSASANGTGIGGAKFQAGRGAHSSFQNSGKSIANANATSANDAITVISDEEEDTSLQLMHGAAHVHRPSFQEGRRSIFQQGLRSRLTETNNSLQLILPNHHGLYIKHVRAISTSRSAQKSAVTLTRSNSDMEGREGSSTNEADSNRGRSLSTTANTSQELNSAISERANSPIEGIAIGGQRSAKVEVAEGEPEGSRTSYMYEDLLRAIESRSGKVIRKTVEDFRNLPVKQLSTPSFNLAIEAIYDLVQTGSQRWADCQLILDLYSQMLDSDCAPNHRTRATVIGALCNRDTMRLGLPASDLSEDGVATPEAALQQQTSTTKEADVYERSDVDFTQALALMDLTHSLGSGFASSKAYNSLLICCKHRGDVKTACHVLDLLSGNKRAEPNALTFRCLLGAFSTDALRFSDETLQDFNSRKLQACQQVFEEFEVFRNAEGWDSVPRFDITVWNSMIRTSFDLGDPVGALRLIEQVIGVEKSEGSGNVAAPAASKQTTEAILEGLLYSNDLVGAITWFERIVTMNTDVVDGQRAVLYLPDAKIINKIIQTLSETMLTVWSRSKNDKGVAEKTIDECLPLVEMTNRAMLLLYKKVDENVSWSLTSNTSSWDKLLTVDNLLIDALLKCGRKESANALLDQALSLVEQQYAKHPEEVDGSLAKTPIETRKACYITRDICQIIQKTNELERWQDGAACLSYAAFALPEIQLYNKPERSDDPEVVSASKVAYRLFRMAAYDVMGDLTGMERGSEKEFKMRAGADANMHLRISLKYVMPALHKLRYLQNTFKMKMQRLYRLAKQEKVDVVDPELNTLDWNYLLHCFTRKTSLADNENLVEDLKMLFADLSKVSDEIKNELHVQDAIHFLPSLFGEEEALAMLKSVRPSITLENIRNPGWTYAYQHKDSPYEIREQVDRSVRTEGQSEDSTSGIASPVTAATSMEGDAVGEINFAPVGGSITPIQTIDLDLGHHLAQECKAAQRDRYATDQVYRSMMKSIEESGTYPSPNAISSLLNAYARFGEVSIVKDIYAIGTNIVAALGGDPVWQREAWYDLEDSMTAALAHGGDPILASEHRHRLINAGRAPKADTYGALITVIRDTTDDALVAEELFDESQRLGVKPTVFLYNTLLSKLSRARKAERAMQLFEEMRNRGLPPSSVTYGAVLNACTRTGDEVNAEAFFSMMESDHRFKPGVPPFNTMVQFYTQTKPNREKALFYYAKLAKFRLQPTSHTYKLLLDLYGSIAPVDLEAMNTVFGTLIGDKKVAVQGNHWASLITAHGIHCKDLDQAVQIYHDIPDHVATRMAGKKGQEPDALAFEALLSVFLEHGRLDLIEKYIEERKTSGCEMTAYVANVLIKAFSAMDSEHGLERARAIFEEMKDPPMGVAAIGNHPLARQHVSGAHHDGGAMSSQAGFAGLSREPSTFETMIKVEMDHGNKAEVLALIERMQHRGYPPVVVARAQEALQTITK